MNPLTGTSKEYDAALNLRIAYDNGIRLTEKDALNELKNSELVKRLTSELSFKPLFLVWRIIALSRIPYTQYLEYTQQIVKHIFEKLATPFGFSLSGDEKMFLPCYNAMLVSALSRLGCGNEQAVKNAVSWINRYQPMERGIKVSIPGFNFERYGGCFKQTPCYISVAKSTIALWEYEKTTGDISFQKKKEQGVEYILQHHLLKRISIDKPITRNIQSISFPESYHLNIVELIELISSTGYLHDERTTEAVNFLLSKRNGDGWKIDYRYRADGYTVFDEGRQNGQWVSYIINKALKG